MTRLHSVQSESKHKRAVAVVMMAVVVPVLLGFAALSVDVGSQGDLRPVPTERFRRLHACAGEPSRREHRASFRSRPDR